MLDIQGQIDALEEQMNELKQEKTRTIREFNAPVIQSIVGTIKGFLQQELDKSGEDSLDISDIGLTIRTGEYEDCNTDGSKGEIVYGARELKLDDGKENVLIGYQTHCGPFDWGSDDEKITERLWVLRDVADYLAKEYGVEYEALPATLIFNGDQAYYTRRLEEGI